MRKTSPLPSGNSRSVTATPHKPTRCSQGTSHGGKKSRAVGASGGDGVHTALPRPSSAAGNASAVWEQGGSKNAQGCVSPSWACSAQRDAPSTAWGQVGEALVLASPCPAPPGGAGIPVSSDSQRGPYPFSSESGSLLLAEKKRKKKERGKIPF